MKATGKPMCAEAETLRRIIASLQGRIGPQKFNAWFKHGTTLSLDEGRLRVAVPNPFTANWIEQHYHADLAETLHEHTTRRLAVVVTVDPSLSGQCRKRDFDMQAKLVSRAAQGLGRNRGPVKIPALKHRLDDFVVGQSNKLAYTAALTAADRKNSHFGQLFLHGPCGVGKTHLLQGICNACAESRARRGGSGKLKWRYVTGEQFTNEFIASVRNRNTSEFRARYRKLDILAIDDVHFLAAKRATQEEFLHTFNAIESAGKQIILASDAHPRMVGDLNEQLVSRFICGMVVKVDSPDRSTRREILIRKAGLMKLNLSADVLDYLAIHIRGSVRELEGTLMKLLALAALENGRITLELARDALADHLARADSAVTLGDIEATVAAFFGITPADIHSSRRTRTVSAARAIAMFLARRHTRMSFPEIGRFMGKNHSSVILATQRMEKALAADGEITWSTPVGAKSMPAGELVELLNEQIR